MSSNDYHYATKNRREEATIPPQGAYTYTITLEIPDAGDFSNTGQNYLIVKVDFPKNVAENDETNNTRAQSITIESFLPDIIFKNASVSPTTAASSQAITLTYAIDENVPNSINMQGVISMDNQFGGNNDLSSINFVNQSFFGNNATQTMTIPSHIPDGNYHLIIRADWNNQYQEISESNNFSSAIPITISSPSQPNGDPTNLQITDIGDGVCKLNWVPISNNTLIGMNNNDEVILPCDDYFEQGNADFLQASIICDERRGGQAIYFGTGNTVNVNNLPTNRDISVKAFSANVYNGGSQVDYYQNSTKSEETDDYYMFKAVAENEIVDKWEHLSYQTIDFIQPINSSLIYAADNGRFYKSTDGGKVWNVRGFTSLGANIWTESMQFLNSQVGFIGGQTGELYKTVDGGNSWQLKYELSGEITNIHFINNAIGFIIGGKSVHKTQNGGETWTEVGSFAKSVFDIHCLDQNTMYVSTNSGIVYVSLDGGITWESRPCPTLQQFNAVYFTSKTEGWLGSTSGKVYKTEDGGQSWTNIIVPSSTSNFILDIKSINNALFIFGTKNILRSFDKGDTWQDLTKPSTSSIGNYYLDENYFFLLTRDDTYRFQGNILEGDIQINQPSLSQNSYCSGDDLGLTFSLSEAADYLIELSDANGNFANETPIIIGQGNGSGNISAIGIIPSNTTSSTNYKIRVVINSIPKVVSNSTPSFSINAIPTASISNLPNQLATTDASITLNGTPSGGQFKINNINASTFNPNSLGIGIHEVIYEISQNGCTSSVTQYVTVGEGKSIFVFTDNNSICAGFDFVLQVQMDGNYLAEDIFNIQLSDKNGDFTTPLALQSFFGQQFGTFVIAIPNTVVSGSNYKVRIIGDDGLTSNLTSSFSISAAPNPNILINDGETSFSEGASIFLSNATTDGGANPTTNWYRNGSLFASNKKVVTVNNPLADEVVYTSILSNAQCAKNFEIFSDPVILNKLGVNEKLDCNGDDFNLIDTPSEDKYYRSGEEIISTQKINSDIIISYKAGNAISLKPGFSANAGSNFIAKIEACNEAIMDNCTDNIQNGDETGVDCGGTNCPACPTQPKLLALKTTEVKFTYPSAVSANSVTKDALTIIGEETGAKTGTYTVNSNLVTFVPTVPFKAGEQLYITSTSAIEKTNQTAMPAFTWMEVMPVTNPTNAIFSPLNTGITLPSDALNYSYSFFSADFNQDGRMDILVNYYPARGSATKNLIYLQNANGSYAAPSTYSSTRSYSSLRGTPDLNGDGYPDLVVTHNVPSSVNVRLNNGDGTLGSSSLYTVTNYSVGVDFADIDGDGDIDMIGKSGNASLSSNRISIFRNKGDGTFNAQETISTNNGYGHYLRLGDLDNDGDVDIIFTTSTSFGAIPTFKVYKNNGLGSFSLHKSEANPNVRGILPILDFNNDGQKDMVSFNTDATVHLGNTGFDFSLGNGTAVTSEQGRFHPGDINGDGFIGLLNYRIYNGTNWTSFPYKTYLNNGNGAFTKTNGALNMKSFQALRLSDMDGDGDLDYLYVDTDRKIYIAENGNNTNLSEIPLESRGTENDPALRNVLGAIQLKVMPNPFHSETTIQYYLPKEGSITLQIRDFLGRKIKTLEANTQKQKGSHQIQFQSNNLPAGTYFLVLNSNGLMQTKKMVIVR